MAAPADFLIDNTHMAMNVLEAAKRIRPKHLLVTLSTCMYPDQLAEDDYPMDESLFDAGPPPPTNAPYALAKRALLVGTRALHEQYGVPFTALIPTNLYGPGDHFGEDGSHFLAAAIDKGFGRNEPMPRTSPSSARASRVGNSPLPTTWRGLWRRASLREPTTTHTTWRPPTTSAFAKLRSAWRASPVSEARCCSAGKDPTVNFVKTCQRNGFGRRFLSGSPRKHRWRTGLKRRLRGTARSQKTPCPFPNPPLS